MSNGPWNITVREVYFKVASSPELNKRGASLDIPCKLWDKNRRLQTKMGYCYIFVFRNGKFVIWELKPPSLIVIKGTCKVDRDPRDWQKLNKGGSKSVALSMSLISTSAEYWSGLSTPSHVFSKCTHNHSEICGIILIQKINENNQSLLKISKLANVLVTYLCA